MREKTIAQPELRKLMFLYCKLKAFFGKKLRTIYLFKQVQNRFLIEMKAKAYLLV